MLGHRFAADGLKMGAETFLDILASSILGLSEGTECMGGPQTSDFWAMLWRARSACGLNLHEPSFDGETMDGGAWDLAFLGLSPSGWKVEDPPGVNGLVSISSCLLYTSPSPRD